MVFFYALRWWGLTIRTTIISVKKHSLNILIGKVPPKLINDYYTLLPYLVVANKVVDITKARITNLRQRGASAHSVRTHTSNRYGRTGSRGLGAYVQ